MPSLGAASQGADRLWSMRDMGKSGSVGATGGQPPVATRPSLPKIR